MCYNEHKVSDSIRCPSYTFANHVRKSLVDISIIEKMKKRGPAVDRCNTIKSETFKCL